MTNGDIFRVTGLLWGESIGHRWVPSQRPVTRGFDVFFNLCVNNWFSKQSRWFETQSCSLWRHCNEEHTQRRLSFGASAKHRAMCAQIIVRAMFCSPVNHRKFNEMTRVSRKSLEWRHNELDGVSKHRRLDYLLNRFFRRRSKKTSKLRVTGLCEGNSPVTGEFPAQRASNAENVSIWWRHHVRPAVHYWFRDWRGAY